MLVDSHCHLDRLKLPDQPGAMEEVILRAQDAGVEKMLCVATDLARWEQMLATVAPFPQVMVSAGVHPLSDEIDQLDLSRLRAQVSDPRVVAVGETGLDYHYQPDSLQNQRHAFQAHLALAAELQKPVIIHTREAQADTLKLLREASPLPAGGVLHCFTESWEMAAEALELGLMISFSGIITFRNAQSLRDVVRQVPLERLLVETDAPYLTPAPFRGRSNEPQYVRRVAECVAEIKGCAYQQVVEQTGANFRQLFCAS